MRVDCYNASSCPLSDLMAGDTFYLDGVLHIKAAVCSVDVVSEFPNRSYIVALDTGALRSVQSDIPVILADTVVVARDGK